MTLTRHPHKKTERRLRDVVCPQCDKEFRLCWNDYTTPDGKSPARDIQFLPETLLVRDCPSGGIYDVRIRCPHCKYEEPL